MLLSIIIPAFNEEKLLTETLQRIGIALSESNFNASEFEIIVCDNNSTDLTAEIAGSHGARVVFEERNQISLARNKGAEHANGKWLLFIDADSYPSTELINDVRDVILDNKHVGGGSTMTFGQEHTKKTILLLAFINLWMRLKNFAAGAFFLCRAKDFRAVDGFSSHLYVAEELDLTQRLKDISEAPNNRFKILNRHPFHTSSRKFKLYTSKERRKFYWAMVLSGSKAFKDRAKLGLWYDGRR